MPLALTAAAASLAAPRAARRSANPDATPRGPSRQDRFFDSLRADVVAQGMHGVALPLAVLERQWCAEHDPATRDAKTPWRSLDASICTDAAVFALPADIARISADEMKVHGIIARTCILVSTDGTPAASLVAGAIASLVQARDAALAARTRLAAAQPAVTAAQPTAEQRAMDRAGLNPSEVMALRELAADGDADAIAELEQHGLSLVEGATIAVDEAAHIRAES